MNKDILKGHWHELIGSIKEKWGNLTDDDLSKLEGTTEQLSGLLQKKYGYNRDRAEKEIKNFLKDKHVH